jgi:tripartite-type tricarboxylate transporter receptor subunit TctC
VAEIEKVVDAPDVAARIRELGSVPGTAFGDAFGAFMAAETTKWAAVIKASGARAD